MRIHLRHATVLVVALAGMFVAARGLPYLWFAFADGVPPADTVVRGVLHVHLPDDDAQFQGLVNAARGHGLDFIIFTETGGLDAARDGREGYYTSPDANQGAAAPILVLIAAEVPTDRGNLLVLGGSTDTHVPLTRRSQRVISAVTATGGVALALGPCDTVPPAGALAAPAHLDPPAGVVAVEAISLAASFRAATYVPAAVAGALAPLHLDGALAALAPVSWPDRRRLDDRDWAGSAAPVGGIGRNAGRGWGDGPAELGDALRWVTTRLRLSAPPGRQRDSFASDRAAVLDALAAGRSMASVEAWGDPSALTIVRDARSIRAMVAGDVEPWLVLRHNGRIVASRRGSLVEASIDGPGVWRVEAYRSRHAAGLPGDGWLLWIVAGENFAAPEPLA